MDLVAIPILITDPNKIVRYQSFKYPDYLLKKNRIENIVEFVIVDVLNVYIRTF